MVKKVFACFFLICLTRPVIANLSERVKVCGYVVDGKSKEPLIGANLFVTNTQFGTTTDYNGYFCVYLKNHQPNTIQCSFVGYQSLIMDYTYQKDSVLIIQLKPGISINDVTVTAKINKRADVVSISNSTIRSTLSLTGEPDVLKTLQYLPGIQTGKEGTSDLYVRGGDKDENNYLLDGVPLYYVNHLGGFMSVFDASIIKDVTVYKGVIPARYGGRLSSAIDIRLKDGDVSKAKHEFMLGTLASKIYTEGNLSKKNKTTYVLSLRRCNLDLLMRSLAWMSNGGATIEGYTFYDATIKLTHQFSSKSKLTFHSYWGRDKLFSNYKSEIDSGVRQKSNTHWGNKVYDLKWNYIYKNGIIQETSLTSNSFFNTTDDIRKTDTDRSKDQFSSRINDYSLTTKLGIYQRKIKIYAGSGLTMHHYQPAINSSTNDESFEAYKLTDWFPELNFFIDVNYDVTQKLSIDAGIRSSYWLSQSDWKVSPGIMASYALTDHLFLNSGYSYNFQFMHQISSITYGSPVALWVPAGNEFRPKSTQQYSIGLKYTKGNYAVYTEYFSRNWNNLISFNPTIESADVLNWDVLAEKDGKGYAKGIEIGIEKKLGNLTGSIGYTYSRNFRQFDNINNGEYFPFKYDRPHELGINTHYRFNEKKSLSVSWVFQTGSPLTMPLQQYQAINPGYDTEVEFADAHYYGSINNYRTPAYHRLDIGYSRTKTFNGKSRILYVGLYNAYCRMNPFYIYLKKEQGDLKIEKYALFPILPVISYTVKF